MDSMEKLQAKEHNWPSQMTLIDQKSSSTLCGLDIAQDHDSAEKLCSKKRVRLQSSSAKPGTRACREKIRRDRLNDRFLELWSMMKPGRSQNCNKFNKVAILTDAARLLNQLHLQIKKLKEKKELLVDTINNLKAEKIELREEKLMLKEEKERMENVLKGMSFQSFFAPYFALYATANSKTPLLPLNYRPQMCQWNPTSSWDTFQDHVLRPPVA